MGMSWGYGYGLGVELGLQLGLASRCQFASRDSAHTLVKVVVITATYLWKTHWLQVVIVVSLVLLFK